MRIRRRFKAWCALLVPKGMSKSSNSCPSHTCQISVSLPFLRRLRRAAAPLWAEEPQELQGQPWVCAAPGERPRWSWHPTSLRAGAKPRLPLPAPARDVSVSRTPLSEQTEPENHCSDVCAVHFRMNQGLLLAVPAGYRTGRSHRNHDGRWHAVTPLFLPSSHRCLAKG